MPKTSAPRNSGSSKKDTIVAVRLPTGLVNELKGLQESNHFLDMSDEIRFIIRKYCLNIDFQQNPEQKSLIERQRDQTLIKELDKIVGQLKHGGAEN
jgi:hypothetical protein